MSCFCQELESHLPLTFALVTLVWFHVLGQTPAVFCFPPAAELMSVLMLFASPHGQIVQMVPGQGDGQM